MKSNLERIQDLEEDRDDHSKRLARLEWDLNVAFRKINDVASDVGLLIIVLAVGGAVGIVLGLVACFWYYT